jgi:hypothetical protein
MKTSLSAFRSTILSRRAGIRSSVSLLSPFHVLLSSAQALALTSVLCRSLCSLSSILHPLSSSISPRALLASTVALALTANVASTLATYPHTLSHFNEIATGPLNGLARLLDANIDWGQDLLYLKDWYDAHPEVEPLHLAYFGLFPPVSRKSFRPVARVPPLHCDALVNQALYFNRAVVVNPCQTAARGVRMASYTRFDNPCSFQGT